MIMVCISVVLDVIALMIVTLLDKPFPMWAYSFIFYIQVRKFPFSKIYGKKCVHLHFQQMAPYVSEAFIPGFDVVGKYVSLVKHP